MKQATPEAPIGSVITPAGKEATAEHFYFWAHDDCRVEKTQLVVTDVMYHDGMKVRFYGVVDEVARQGQATSIHVDHIRQQENVNGGRRIQEIGTTYAKVKILATSPKVFTPPLEGADVRYANVGEAGVAYGFDRVKQGAPVGLLRNGASRHAGPAILDLGYLLGENGAHLNINGVSGVATKTSSMLVTIFSIMQTVERLRAENPSSTDRYNVIPVLFSVKGTDMLWLDRRSRVFEANPEFRKTWEAMGIEPKPFDRVRFLVPAREDNPKMAQPVVRRDDLVAYSYGLGDVVAQGLLPYLFSADDKQNLNFSHLLNTFEERLTGYDPRSHQRVLRAREDGLHWNRGEGGTLGGTPQTFKEWVQFLRNEIDQREKKESDYSSAMDSAHVATIRAFYRRLRRLERESCGVIAWDKPYGQPPEIHPSGREAKMYVIDIASLARSSDMQRFVISAVLNQLKEQRTDRNAARGVRYLIGLDELNQWAPKGTGDATTALFEKLSAEMRSIGIILLGAQQFASQISLKVAGNASVRMIGRTDPGELSDALWRFLSDADKRLVTQLQQGEQLLNVPPFRAPAYVTVPFPPCAMRMEEVLWEESLIEEDSEDMEPVIDVTGSNLFQ